MFYFKTTDHATTLIDQVIPWARQAGRMALSYFGNIEPQLKADQTYLTKADVEIEQFLTTRIRAAFPDDALIGEEGGEGAHYSPTKRVWTIDPIDGTTAFVQGLPGWGIAIGVLKEGQPIFGVYYMPALDDMTYATTSGEVYLNGQSISHRIQTDWGNKGFLAVNASAHYDYKIDIKRTRALGSISTNLVYVARGTATAAFMPKARLWDLVAGAAILSRAGGELRYLSGRPLDYLDLLDGRLIPEPIIAGHPQVLEGIDQAIRSY